MKCMLRFSCLFAVICLLTADARAGSAALSPIDGISRTLSYGQTYDPDSGMYDGPQGLLFQFYSHGTNGSISDDYDGRSSNSYGSISDLILLYDLRGLSAATLSDVILRFQVGRVSVNSATDGSMDTGIGIRISGSNNSTLSVDDFTTPSVGWSGISAPSGDYHNDPLIKTADVTTSFAKLLDQGFDHATLYLYTADSVTTSGPLDFSLTTAPILNVTGTGIHPNVSPVPEPSTIVQIGISVVGLGLYALRSKLRAR